jgi:5'-3' exoribonuclease 2
LLPKRALDQNDIEMTKGRAARSGRGYGGAPLRGGQQGDRGRDSRDSFNYTPNNSYSRQPQPNTRPPGTGNGYNGYGYPQPNSMGWQPPVPGAGGFARGPPPPPPNAGYGSYPQPSYGGYPPALPAQHAQQAPGYAPGTYNPQYQQGQAPHYDNQGSYRSRNDDNRGYNPGPGRY